MRKTYIKGYVLSLSGGADSSSIAVLVAHMIRVGIKELGIKGFSKAIHLDPSSFSTDESQAAKQITHPTA